MNFFIQSMLHNTVVMTQASNKEKKEILGIGLESKAPVDMDFE